MKKSLLDLLSLYVFDNIKIERKFIKSGPYVCTIYDIRVGGIITKIKEEGHTIEESMKRCLDSIKNIEKR